MEVNPLYGVSSFLIGEEHKRCCSPETKGKNVIKVIRRTASSGNSYYRIVRYYALTSQISHPADIYPIGHYINGSKFIIVEMETLEEGYVIDYDGNPTNIRYWDIKEKIERIDPSVVSILTKHKAKLLDQIENYDGLEYLMIRYPNRIGKQLIEDLMNSAIIIYKVPLNHASAGKRMQVAAWQAGAAIYSAIQQFKGPRYKLLQSRLLPRVDFERHRTVLFYSLPKEEFSKIGFDGRTADHLFGKEKLTFSIATLTYPQAIAWDCITKALNSSKGNHSISYGIRSYQDNVDEIGPKSIRRLYYRAVNKFEKKIKETIGKDDDLFSDDIFATTICNLIMRELLNSNFLWTPVYNQQDLEEKV